MASATFEPWPKIARLNRDIVITEKIDGSNAAIHIATMADHAPEGARARFTDTQENIDHIVEDWDGWLGGVIIDGVAYTVSAQSRKNIILPEKGKDNFGFAQWVSDNIEPLVRTLGPGRHFGEWWGSGIQRGYGLTNGEKRFSLFNTLRWSREDLFPLKGIGVSRVPVLYEGPNDSHAIEQVLELLRRSGSLASPGFMDPEGIIVFHTAARIPFKVTLKGDEKPKGSKE